MTNEEQRDLHDQVIVEQAIGILDTMDLDSQIPDSERAAVKATLLGWMRKLKGSYRIRPSRKGEGDAQ